MFNDTHKALEIVKWYRNKFLPTKPPGNWKLVLRPAIKEWLLDMARQTKDLR